MKKLIIAVAALLTFTASAQEEKKYKLELSDDQVQTIWYALDKSTAEHMVVKELQTVIREQLKAQYRTDTTTTAPAKNK